MHKYAPSFASVTLSLSCGTYVLSFHTQSSPGTPRPAQPDADQEPRRARAFSLPPGLLAAGVDPQIFCGVWGQSGENGEKKRDGRRRKSTLGGMPSFCRAAQKRGDGLMQNGQFREALQAYSTALKAGATALSDSRKSLIYAYRSRAYLRCGDKPRAKQDASLSLALDPNSKQAQDSRARAHAAVVADIPCSLTLATGSGQVLDLDLGRLKMPVPPDDPLADDLSLLERMHQETPRFRRHLQRSRSETQIVTLAKDRQDNCLSLPSPPSLSRPAGKASRRSSHERAALAKLAAAAMATREGDALCSALLSHDDRETVLSKVCSEDAHGTHGLSSLPYSLRSAETRRYTHIET
jgi:tetratricopeptide (TPR) repeat protein